MAKTCLMRFAEVVWHSADAMIRVCLVLQTLYNSCIVQESQELKFDIECTGAKLNLAQPDTIENMVKYATKYARNNQGVRYHAVLLPFSALNSYNEAEAQYDGVRQMSWVDHGSNILKDLNFEHVRLQRLKRALADKAQLTTVVPAVREDAKQKVRHPCSHSNSIASWIYARMLGQISPQLSPKYGLCCCNCNVYCAIQSWQTHLFVT